jgi:predicted GNAT family N-acyltransferase
MSIVAIALDDSPKPSRAAEGIQRVLSRLLPLAARCSIVCGTAEMEKVYALRYRIYIQELRKALPWADHERKHLTDPHDRSAVHFMVRKLGGEVIGCSRLHFGTSIPEEFLDAMKVRHLVEQDGHRCAYVSKLMVERSLRGKGASLLMMRKMIEHGVAAGADYAVFHCNPKLCRLYERYGFRRFGQTFEMQHVGTQVCMVNILADADHFSRVNSPLADFVRQYRTSLDRLQTLRSSFGLT